MDEVSVRTKKVASVVRKELMEILRHEVKDPRVQNIGMITISNINLAKDHKNATVYVSFLNIEQVDKVGGEERVQESIYALNRIAPFLRSSLKKRVSMKVVPELYFRFDKNFTQAALVLETLQNINSASHAP